MNALPIVEFEGKVYTIDKRLGQFRCVSYNPEPSIVFVDFDSELGQRIIHSGGTIVRFCPECGEETYQEDDYDTIRRCKNNHLTRFEMV